MPVTAGHTNCSTFQPGGRPWDDVGCATPAYDRTEVLATESLSFFMSGLTVLGCKDVSLLIFFSHPQICKLIIPLVLQHLLKTSLKAVTMPYPVFSDAYGNTGFCPWSDAGGCSGGRQRPAPPQIVLFMNRAITTARRLPWRCQSCSPFPSCSTCNAPRVRWLWWGCEALPFFRLGFLSGSHTEDGINSSKDKAPGKACNLLRQPACTQVTRGIICVLRESVWGLVNVSVLSLVNIYYF